MLCERWARLGKAFLSWGFKSKNAFKKFSQFRTKSSCKKMLLGFVLCCIIKAYFPTYVLLLYLLA